MQEGPAVARHDRERISGGRTVTIETISPTIIDDTLKLLGGSNYLADRPLATAVFLTFEMRRPLFLEDEAGALGFLPPFTIDDLPDRKRGRCFVVTTGARARQP